jgi:hypothetical protein
MGFPDALLFMLLALLDGLLLVYLRLRRRDALRLERMNRSLRFAVERESRDGAPARHWRAFLERAS